MNSKTSIPPIAEFVFVFLGALGVAALFQDYACLANPELVSYENVSMKYVAVFVGSVIYMVVKRR